MSSLVHLRYKGNMDSLSLALGAGGDSHENWGMFTRLGT